MITITYISPYYPRLLIAQPSKSFAVIKAVIIGIMPASDSDSSATTLEEESEVASSVLPRQTHRPPRVPRQKPPSATNSEEDSIHPPAFSRRSNQQPPAATSSSSSSSRYYLRDSPNRPPATNATLRSLRPSPKHSEKAHSTSARKVAVAVPGGTHLTQTPPTK